jgi:hypothetical protein
MAEEGMSELDPFELFLDLQLALPRNGPGSAVATEIAFSMLPPEDWWDEYYTPMRKRIAEMQAEYGEEAEGVLSEAEAEIALFENNPGQYSYVF